ncbi:hypothetical protein PR202_gb18870 [Eleusine coracana subsp. coracana]|uniref:FRIGIDA-like protein n=1 Tax=Eleusine coracana subsp. coracana TaxID=191504 RepID=A0AAV5F627_ELECO|nr:hypothetical protein PR202_gb18870 [Eleusine coracana subsp. coracana]
MKNYVHAQIFGKIPGLRPRTKKRKGGCSTLIDSFQPEHTPPVDRVSAAAGAAAMANAAPSIPAAIASLQTYSTALAAFTAAWRALESEAVGLDSALASRLACYSELELLCSAMDGDGLRAHLMEHRDELKEPAPALDPALLVAPDPGLLVLSAAAVFCRAPPEEARTEGDVKVSCRLLIGLLDRLRAIGVKPSLQAREEARAVAADWKRGKRIGTEVVFKQETFAFLLLVGVFGLVEDVGGAGEVLDLVVSIAGRERAVDAFVALGLDLEQHMPGFQDDAYSVITYMLDSYGSAMLLFSAPCTSIKSTQLAELILRNEREMKTLTCLLFELVLIQKMTHKGKQLEVVKFIQALNLAHKYPLLPVLRSYISAAALAGKMIRIRGDDPASQNAADAKERTLLGTLQKFIKEHNLDELPVLEEANKRMAELERQSAERKRAAAAAIAAAKKVSENIQQQQKLQQLMLPAKRPKRDNVVQGSLGQSIHPAEGLNQHQTALAQKPAVAQIPQLLVTSHHPVGTHSQVSVAPVVRTMYGGLADFYGVTPSRPYGSGSLAPGPSAQNVPGAGTSSRSKLYSRDPLKAVSRSSDKKGSSYSYSLSSMSTYDPK